MLADIEADAIFGMVDLVITGHFSLPEQVEIAAGVLGRVREASERPPVMVVDPILGDAPGGLYVRPDVAEAVARRLVPLADWLTPNLWELGHLTGAPIETLEAAVAAARRLGKPAVITSAPARDGETGVLFVDAETAILFALPKLPKPPKGTGDLVTASFGAGLVEGLAPIAAAERAARAATEAVNAAQDWRAPELPIVALGPRLVRPSAQMRIERP
jgi:pyridoxine kinase